MLMNELNGNLYFVVDLHYVHEIMAAQH